MSILNTTTPAISHLLTCVKILSNRESEPQFKLYHQEFNSYLAQSDQDLLRIHPRHTAGLDLRQEPIAVGYTIFLTLYS